MKLDEAINKRCSCREYSKKKVHWGDILEAIDAAIKAPLAGNICNAKFVIVNDQKTKNKLAECCVQDWVADASHLIVIVSDIGQLKKMYDDHAEDYSKIQVGAMIENLLLKLTDLKLGSCWVGSFTDTTIHNLLKIPEKFKVEAIITVGVPEKNAKMKQSRKTSLERAIYWESWMQNKKPGRVKEPRA